MQMPGVPDRYVLHTRWMGWLEFKGRRTKLKLHQKMWIRNHNKRRPHTAFVVRYPGYLQTEEGVTLGLFSTGKELLHLLAEISCPQLTEQVSQLSNPN